MPRFRLHNGLADFRAAVGAFISEVDLRHAPMRLDVAHIHRNSDAAWTQDEGGFNIVMMDIGWHVGSPQEDTQESIHQWSLTRSEAYASGVQAIMNSREHTKNVHTILTCVAYLHSREHAGLRVNSLRATMAYRVFDHQPARALYVAEQGPID
jgi:hypothetical protein